MRFDLEFNIVSEITQDSLDKISDLFYGDTGVTPAFWDKNSLLNRIDLNVGSVNIGRYNKRKNLDQMYISSGVSDTDSNILSLFGDIENQGFVTPIFNGGKYSSNKSSFIWSKNAIVKAFTFKNGYYQAQIDDNINTSDIIIFTLEFHNQKYYSQKRTFIFVNYNESIENTFKKSKLDYKYTILDNVIYLNIDEISYNTELIKLSDLVYILPEFPVYNLEIIGLQSSNFTYNNGTILINKDTEIPDRLFAKFKVNPILSFIDSNRTNDDLLYSNINMHPKLLNYTNGTICLQPSFSGAEIASKITLSVDKDTIFGNEAAKVNAKLDSLSGMAISNKDITFKILSNNGIFIDNNLSEITLKTLISGEVNTDMIAKTDRIGYYIQPEWVDGAVITLPFSLSGINTESTYLYFVTADDPILGKRYSNSFETPFSESYSNSEDISTYEMNGRKIAYVSLQDDNGTLRSRFIKPIEIEQYENIDNEIVEIRGLNLDQSLLSSLSGNNGIYNLIPEYITKITYSNIPNSNNIVGFWLITDTDIKIKAYYSDANIDLVSDELSVRAQNIKSENSFTLNKYSASSSATQLGSFGYYTISEYLKNPYGLNALSFYCTYSDCIYKKCLYPDPLIQFNFILDQGRVGCIHTPDYDNTEGNASCPKQDAHLVNPFIMHTQII